MAINKLPKLYSTDFRLPNKKPIGDVEIDWAAKESNSLTLSVIRRIGDPVEVRDFTGKSKQSANINVTSKGDYLNFDADTDQIRIGRSPALEPENITIITKCRIQKTGSFSTIITKDANSFANPYYSYHLRTRNNNFDKVEFYIGNGSTFAEVATPSLSFLPYYDKDIYIVAAYDGVTARISVFDMGLNELLSASANLSLGDIGYYPTDLCLGKMWTGTLPGMSGGSRLYELYLFSKGLSESRCKSFISNRFNSLKPKSAPVYFTADGGGSTITVIESLNNSNYVTLDPTILLTGSISITESVVNTNYTALNPIISFVGIISISESPVNTNYTVLNPAISFTGTIAVTESLVNVNYTALSPTVDFTGIVEVAESLANSDYNALNATVTLTSGAVEIIESTVNTQYAVFNPSILLTPEPLGIVSTVCFNGVLVDLNYSGESGLLEFSGQLETAIFNGEFNALDFSGTIQTTCADGDIKTNC